MWRRSPQCRAHGPVSCAHPLHCSRRARDDTALALQLSSAMTIDCLDSLIRTDAPSCFPSDCSAMHVCASLTDRVLARADVFSDYVTQSTH